MDQLSPDGTIYQAGTLSGNPVCVAAGIATLKVLKTQNPYPKLAALTEALCGGICQTLAAKGIPNTINQIGSMFTVFFSDTKKVTDYKSAAKSNTKQYAKYFRHMLNNGIYLPPSQFEANFLSTEHTDRYIDHTLTAISRLKF